MDPIQDKCRPKLTEPLENKQYLDAVLRDMPKNPSVELAFLAILEMWFPILGSIWYWLPIKVYIILFWSDLCSPGSLHSEDSTFGRVEFHPPKYLLDAAT